MWYCQNAEGDGWAACYCATSELADALPTCTRTFSCCMTWGGDSCQCNDYSEAECQAELTSTDWAERVLTCPP